MIRADNVMKCELVFYGDACCVDHALLGEEAGECSGFDEEEEDEEE